MAKISYSIITKARVVEEALKGEKSLTQIGKDFGEETPIHPSSISLWIKDKDILAVLFLLQKLDLTTNHAKIDWEQEVCLMLGTGLLRLVEKQGWTCADIMNWLRKMNGGQLPPSL